MTDTAPSTESPEAAGVEADGEGLPTTTATQDANTTDTSTVTQPANGEATSEQEDGKPADGGAEKPKSAFEAAKAALKKGKGAASPAEDANSQKPKIPVGDKSAAKPEGEAEDDGIPKEFHKHPAWVRIAKDRDTFKVGHEKWERFNELVQNGGYGDTAAVEGWLNGGTQLNQAGVTADERNLLLEYAVASKTNPQRAFEILKPIYEAYQELLGDVLPADLQQAVDSGEMTEDAARRLSRSEASSKIAGRRAQLATDQANREREAQQQTQAEEAQATAVVSWEQRKAATDPDWARIAPAVVETVNMLRASRKTKTPEEAVQLCEDAVAFVKRTAGAGTAKPAVIIPQTHQQNRQTAEPPKSAFEAAKRALAR